MRERISERAKLVRDELKSFSFNMAAGDTTCLTKADRIFIIVFLMLGIMLFACSICFADGDLISTAGDQAKNYYEKLFGIVTFVAGLAAIICLIWIAVSPTANAARVPLDWLRRILISYACIMLLGGIFRLIQNVTAGQETLP